ncbi:MAG: hypothetical protein P0S94_05295 [Simkaniaceae bacterium]|nr:hypothetical protein [Simkaniaceae bacterium]
MLLLATILLAAMNPMTPYMPLDEQKRTGVDHLSHQEQKALAEWLNRRTNEKDNQELSLSLNIRAGEILQLNDGTLWQVSPKDVAISSSWLTPVKIEFKDSSNAAYPHILINMQAHQQVMVHPLQKLQPAPSE